EINSSSGEGRCVASAEGGDHHTQRDPATSAGKAFFGNVGSNELGFGHDINGQDIGIGDIHQQVDSRDEKHAYNNGAREVALGLLHFASDEGDSVPAVVSPKCSL